jgi:hypothetical protein
MTKREGEVRREYFGEHVRRWQESGLTQREYCRVEGLGVSAFGYWKRKLCGTSAGQEATELVEVTCTGAQESACGAVVLRIGDRLSIVVREQTDEALLERVLRIVKAV